MALRVLWAIDGATATEPAAPLHHHIDNILTPRILTWVFFIILLNKTKSCFHGSAYSPVNFKKSFFKHTEQVFSFCIPSFPEYMNERTESSSWLIYFAVKKVNQMINFKGEKREVELNANVCNGASQRRLQCRFNQATCHHCSTFAVAARFRSTVARLEPVVPWYCVK